MYCEEHEAYDAKKFLTFLKHLLVRYPGKIVLVLNNARIHHSKLIQPFIEENKPQIELLFLLLYRLNLNLIEGL
ncbi:transposase [Carnobacterium viridans]|uniref:transposase n=1 Tax=Carnobacterium viridans TaxID=174587 RepID=UPI000B7EDC2B|nr:transposase [Carnobacterium viridans]